MIMFRTSANYIMKMPRGDIMPHVSFNQSKSVQGIYKWLDVCSNIGDNLILIGIIQLYNKWMKMRAYVIGIMS
jgi:hypothetical protein